MSYIDDEVEMARQALAAAARARDHRDREVQPRAFEMPELDAEVRQRLLSAATKEFDNRDSAERARSRQRRKEAQSAPPATCDQLAPARPS